MGLDPYVISPSPREDGIDGVRYHYSLADLNQEIRDNPIGPNHCIVMTDVDYYVNMPEVLSWGRPILLYTFHPETVAGKVNNGFFTIVDDHVIFRVTGGKTVRHQIWDYNQDVIYTPASDLTLWEALCLAMRRAFGMNARARGVVSHVDQFGLSPHRRIVAITPFAHIKQGVRDSVYGVDLARCRYTFKRDDQKFNMLTFISSEGPRVSMSIAGQLACANIPLSDFEAIGVAHSEAAAKHLSDTVRRSKLEPNEAAVLHKFLNSNTRPELEVHAPGRLSRHFVCVTTDRSTVYDQPTLYARDFANAPLDVSAVFPAECADNDVAGIAGRVTAPQEESRKMQNILPRFYKYAQAFVEHVVPRHERHVGRPWTIDEVNTKQDRPTQRVRTRQRDMDYVEVMVVKAFQKREAYNGPNQPRNISTVPTTHTLRLSSYTYAFKEKHLYNKEWYMPGRCPRDIAAAVHELASRTPEIVETDFSRFDGYINEWLRTNVEFPCYLAWVHPDERNELQKLLNDELNPKARNKTGKYDAGCSRLSGSPLTTDGNTLINAFTAYAAAREEGLTHEEALKRIGLAYGDDGLRDGAGVSDERMVTTAKLLGLKLKVENRARRGERVSFLSRVFHDAWTSTASVQSPLRALLKLHTTTNRTEDIRKMGIAKVSGYLTTDARTPLLSHWCNCYLRCVNSVAMGDVTGCDDAPFWARDHNSSLGPWPQEDGTHDQIIADELGISCADLQAHCALLDAYVGDVMNMPQLKTGQVILPRCDVVLDGEIHHAGSTVSQTNSATTQPGNGNPAAAVTVQRVPRQAPVSTGSSGQSDRARQGSSVAVQGNATANSSPGASGPRRANNPGPTALVANTSAQRSRQTAQPGRNRNATQTGSGRGRNAPRPNRHPRPRRANSPRPSPGRTRQANGVNGNQPSTTN
jgi:hypothetical protein